MVGVAERVEALDPQRPVRIALIDDHKSVLTSLGDDLQRSFNCVELLVAHHAVDVLAAPGTFDLVVLDLFLNDGTDPANNVDELTKRGFPVLIFTQASEPAIARCVQAGAWGVVSKKDSDNREVIAAASVILTGQPHLSRLWASALQHGSRAVKRLSPRENEVLRLLATGRKIPAIGRQLAISEDTVDFHLRNIRAKLNGVADTSTRETLLTAARAHGWLDSPTP